MVIEVPHQTVLIVAFEYNSNGDGSSIQPTSVLSCRIFTHNKTNISFDRAILINGVTSKLIFHHHPQLEKHVHILVSFIQQQQVKMPE